MTNLLIELQRTFRGILTGIKQIVLVLKRKTQNATLAATAQIGPEGIVENLRGDAACIQLGEHTYIRGRLLRNDKNIISSISVTDIVSDDYLGKWNYRAIPK